MSRTIVPWPHPILQTPAEPVAAITDDIRQIWADMVQVMEEMPGYGLAAVQIGVPLRLAVVDASVERGQAILLANPEIVETGSEVRDHQEASPNLPGVCAKLTRPSQCIVQFLNASGETERRAFEGLWSTSVQHQIDHLNGKMFFDNLSRTRRAMLLKKAQKQR